MVLLVSACLPRPSDLWCGNRWKNQNHPNQRPGMNYYLPTGEDDTQVDLVAQECRQACCRSAVKDPVPASSPPRWVSLGVPPGVVLERAELRGWVRSGAGLNLGPERHPATVENELTFELQPDIDWAPDPRSNTTPINSVAALLEHTTPLSHNEEGAAMDDRVMPVIRFHVEVNGWGARACLRPTPESFDTTTLCEFASSRHPRNFNYEIFLRRSETATRNLSDDSDCLKNLDYRVDLPALSSWLPFDLLPQSTVKPYGGAVYCILQRTPDGTVRSPWSTVTNGFRTEALGVEDQYVRLVGTLWEDGNHDARSCWTDGKFSRGWVEMHPVDELELLPQPPHPRRGMCDPTPLPGFPNTTRCVVQLCSEGDRSARMPTFRWQPEGAHPGCRYKVREVLDKSSAIGFSSCPSFLGVGCEGGRVSWDSSGTEFILNATTTGVPGQRRSIVRAGYEITLDCCKRKCEGRCGGDDGCHETCPWTCPPGRACNRETHRCEQPSESDCLAGCEEKDGRCRNGCHGDPDCLKACSAQNGKCQTDCNK